MNATLLGLRIPSSLYVLFARQILILALSDCIRA